MNELEVRVAKLEQKNRRLRRAGLTGLFLVAAAILMGQAPQRKVADEIRARRLLLEDATGNVRLSLGVVSSAELGISGPSVPLGGGLSILDGTGRVHVLLRDGGLFFYDGAGKLRASLYLGVDDRPTLDLRHDTGRLPNAEIAVGKEGGNLLVFDGAGKVHVWP